MVRIGRIVRPLPSASRMSTMKADSPSVCFCTWSRGVVRASSSIRSECSARRGPDLLAVDDVVGRRRGARWCAATVVSVPLVGSVTPKACRRNSPLAIRGRYFAFCVRRAVPQERAHGVHLRVAGGAVAALAVHLLQDRRRGRRGQPGAAVFLRDQRAEIAGLGQRRDELGRDSPRSRRARASSRRESGRRVLRLARGSRRAGRGAAGSWGVSNDAGGAREAATRTPSREGRPGQSPGLPLPDRPAGCRSRRGQDRARGAPLRCGSARSDGEICSQHGSSPCLRTFSGSARSPCWTAHGSIGPEPRPGAP